MLVAEGGGQREPRCSSGSGGGPVISKGLLNRPGQNNCFLNSAVQVLWHLDIFRRSFRELSGHTCMLDSCIFCALKELFAQLQFSHESALPPDALRRALAESFFDQQRFQLGFMDDAAECFENILLRIHFHLACGEPEDLCRAGHCIPHAKFAMTLVEQSVCGACGATSEPLPFTQMVHYVSASALISQAKEAPVPNHPDLFGQLLKKAGGMGDIRDCPSACGAKIQIRRTLTNQPEIVSVGIVWDSERPSLEQVMSLLGTLRTSLRLSEVFHQPPQGAVGSPPPPSTGAAHQLVGVVTYYGKHYSTFFFHTKLRVWIYFDDANVREVGPKWEQVVEKCRRGRYQPLLLLFACPEGRPVDTSGAPRLTTVAPSAANSRSPSLASAAPTSVGCVAPGSNGRPRSLTPSPEKPSSVGPALAQRRALTPNPADHHQGHEISQPQRPLKVVNEYQNLPGLLGGGKAGGGGLPPGGMLWAGAGAMPGAGGGSLRKELVRRDSGNWSGDRNSASSSSSTSLENPYQYILGKVQNRSGGGGGGPTGVPRSPTSLKGGESSSGDPGYDSYSLSSTDSLPLQQSLKHNLQLAQIPEGHQSPASLDLKYPGKKGFSECERLCDEADLLLKESQSTDDLEKALSFATAAVGKARQAMDLPYSNPQAATAARIKHSTCIMHARSIHKRLEEPNGPRHGEGRHSREGSGCSGRGSGSHSRQGSKDKGSHSRQNSKELLPDLKPPSATQQQQQQAAAAAAQPTAAPALPEPSSQGKEESNPEKNIEIYATLPKSRKGLLSRATSKIKNTIEDEEYLMYDRPGRSLNRNKPPNGKKDEKRARSEERNNKTLKEKEFVSNQISKEAKKQIKAEEQKQGKKQHKVRRKLLMGGLIRRKNRSMPDLREDEVPVKGGSKDDTNVGKVEKPPSLSGYLSEGHLEFTGNPNLERSRLMRKSLHGSKLIQMAKVPPPPPLRTTSQLSKDRQFQLNENKLSLWKEPEPQSLPPYTCYNNPEAVTYANGGYLMNSNQNKLVTTAQVHQVSSPVKEFKGHEEEDEFDLPPYPSPLNSVVHSRQASEDFPPPPNELETINPNSLLEQLQRKREQILSEQNSAKDNSEVDHVRSNRGESWLSELQAKQAALRNRDLIETDISFPQESEKLQNSPPDAISTDLSKRLDDQMSTVRDLKSKFETISLKSPDKIIKPSEILPEKPKLNTLTSRESPVVNHCENKTEEIPLKEGEIKSSLANGGTRDELKRKPSKKKNVTFCEQVVLVATAEEDKVNSYIPNPILERVLRSVLHRDPPHQETKEIAVHSVVPLKRNDSGSYGQCAARNQVEQKDNAPDEVDSGPSNAEVSERNTANTNENGLPPSRPYSFQRMLPSPVPGRQPNRMLSNQSPYQPVNGLVSPNMQMPSTSTNGAEAIQNSNSPYVPVTALQQYQMDEQRLARLNGSHLTDADLNKINHIQSNSPTTSDLNSIVRDMEQRVLAQEAMENSQHGLTSDSSHLYNGNSYNVQHNVQQNQGLMLNPGNQQNYPRQAQYNPNYNHPSMSVMQQRSQAPLGHHQVPSNPSQVYQHLPPSVQQAHQQHLAHQQRLMNVQQQQQLRQQQIMSSQSQPAYQSPPVMQQRNLMSPTFHNQAMQSSSLSQGNLSQAQLQFSAQQRAAAGQHLTNGNPPQMKTSPMASVHHEQPAYLSSMSQHHLPIPQNHQYGNQLANYQSPPQLNSQNVQTQGSQKHPQQMPVMAQGHPNNMPSPSPSIKSQMLLNHSQLSLHQMNSQQSLQSGQMLQQNGQSCYMTLPQKMRQPVLNGGVGQAMQGKGRPQGMYQPESPLTDYAQQNPMKKEVPNLRADIYQRVPNLLHSESYPTNQGQFSNSPQFQNSSSSPGQFPNSDGQQPTAASPLNTNNQALTVKYSPYQHLPAAPRQMSVETQKVVSSSATPPSARTSMCNLCRKKPIVSPSIYCADCDFYMSRFKPRT